MPSSQVGRFLALIDRADDRSCWLWQGTRSGKYGWFRTRTGESEYAHRYAYRLWRGEIIERDVCHSCDTPMCCNPHHLFNASQQINVLDCRAKDRFNRKLRHDDVRAMRKLRKETGLSYAKIAKHFGVATTTARRTCTGISWENVS